MADHTDDGELNPDADDAAGVGSEDWMKELLEWDAVVKAGMQPASDMADPYDDDDDDDDDGPITLDWESADPGCSHPWYRLGFIDEGTGLVCQRCGYAWFLDEDEETADALLTVWQSARIEFDRLVAQQASIAAVVEELSGKTRCLVCDRWDTPAAFVQIGDQHACPFHVGALVAQSPEPDELVEDAAEWLVDSGLLESVAPIDQWLVATNVLDSMAVGLASGLDDASIPDTPLRLSSRMAERLSLEAVTTVGEATSALATLLDVDSPSCRPTWTYLLGLIAHIDADPTCDKSAVANAAIPTHGTYRAVIVMDLLRSDMADDISFTGDMADSLVVALTARAVDVLAA